MIITTAYRLTLVVQYPMHQLVIYIAYTTWDVHPHSGQFQHHFDVLLSIYIYIPVYPHDGFYYTDLYSYRIPHNFVGWGKILMKYTLISVHLFPLKSHSSLYVFHFTSPQSGWLYRSCWSFIRLLFCVPCYIMLLLYRHMGDTRTSEDRTYRKTYNHSKMILLSLFLRFICCYLSILYVYTVVYTTCLSIIIDISV